MKKTLLTTSLMVAIAASTISANAFCWQNMNPANWGTCPKCESHKVCKKCEKKCCPCEKKCNPCEEQKEQCDPCKKTMETPPCDPCAKKAAPCDACDKLQDATER